MKYSTREEFLTDYYKLKPHITTRELDVAECYYVPFNYYTIAHESVLDVCDNNHVDFDDNDVHDEFFDSRSLEEYLSSQDVTQPEVAYCFLRKCMMIIDFDREEIYRYEDSECNSCDKYLITTDKKVHSLY